MAKSTISLIAGIFLLISQFGFMLHELDHLAPDNHGKVCATCLAANGLSSPLVSSFADNIVVVPSFDYPAPLYSLTWVEPRSTEFARGPPALQRFS
jgi:hypothetical protein